MAITESAKRTTEITNQRGSNTKSISNGPNARKSTAVARHPTAQQADATATQSATSKPNTPTYEARMRALAPIVRLRRKLEATIKRFSNVATEVKRWKNAPELRETAATIETTLAAMLADAMTVPDSFQPERERKANGRQLAAGTKVTLREKVAAKYEGILEPEERVNLEVVSVARGHVSVKTTSGARLVLARGHVTTMAAPT